MKKLLLAILCVGLAVGLSACCCRRERSNCPKVERACKPRCARPCKPRCPKVCKPRCARPCKPKRVCKPRCAPREYESSMSDDMDDEMSGKY